MRMKYLQLNKPLIQQMGDIHQLLTVDPFQGFFLIPLLAYTFCTARPFQPLLIEGSPTMFLHTDNLRSVLHHTCLYTVSEKSGLQDKLYFCQSFLTTVPQVQIIASRYKQN